MNDAELSAATAATLQSIRDAFKVGPMTPEEARALKVAAQCARHAVMDAAAMCARAGLIASPIQGELEEAHAALCRAIDAIQRLT